MSSTRKDLPFDLHFETGRTWQVEELPPRSIALDGAVRGPFVDYARQIYSFDHHDHCIRHATLSTCEQVRDALIVGLDPKGFHVFVNDVDADTVISTWLLIHPDRLRGPGSAKIRRLVHRVGRMDALGPVWGRPAALHAHLEVPPSEVRTRALLMQRISLLQAWTEGRYEPKPLPPEPARMALMVVDGELKTQRVRGGFRTLYSQAPFGVLATPAPGDSTAYMVGKRSEMVPFDVGGFLAACSAIEAGWGGGSTVGGAPRHPDGSRSRLSLEQVGALLLSVAKRG